MRLIVRLVAIGLFVSSGSVTFARPLDDSWKEETEIDGVKVYVKASADTPRLKEFRSKYVVPLDLATTASLMIRGNNYSKWIDGLIVSDQLESTVTVDPNIAMNDQSIVVYGVRKAIWPLDDRDFVFRAVMKVQQDKAGDPAKLVVKAMDVDGKIPAKPDRVRVKKIEINLELTPVPGDSNSTEVDFGLAIDPGVDAPQKAIDHDVRAVPPKSLKNFAEFAKSVTREDNLIGAVREHLKRGK